VSGNAVILLPREVVYSAAKLSSKHCSKENLVKLRIRLDYKLNRDPHRSNVINLNMLFKHMKVSYLILDCICM